MAWDSKDGLYYNFSINGKEQNFNTSFLVNLDLYHSIFNLFPTISFSVLNKNNLYHQIGLANPKNTLKMEIGEEENDKNLETFKDFIIEKIELDECKSDMSGELILVFVHKNKQDLITLSPAKSWKNKPSSQVIYDIISNYNISFYAFENTTTIGNWLKPNNQSEVNFLKILKNRSIAKDPSKMFMWIDLKGNFHFESLNKMLSRKPVTTLDFTNADIEFRCPTQFDYIDNGIRYDINELNTNSKEYEFYKDGKGVLVLLAEPEIKNLDGSEATNIKKIETFSRKQTMLQGYYHSELPTKYNKAIYVNNIYNFPYRFSFLIKNNYKIEPGVTIEMVFPHHDEDKLADFSLSGNYLVVNVRKMERRKQYINEIHVVSNSQLETIKKL